MKGFKKMLFGEKMPDKQDPKYKERYERDVAAGRKFAKTLRIDKAAAKVQKFADIHRTLFLVIVFRGRRIRFLRPGVFLWRSVRHNTWVNQWKIRMVSFPEYVFRLTLCRKGNKKWS